MIYGEVVWGKRIKMERAREELKIMWVPVLSRATGAARPTPAAALGGLLGIGSAQNSIRVQTDKHVIRQRKQSASNSSS